MYTVYEIKGLHDGGYVAVFRTQEQALEFCRENMLRKLVIGQCSPHKAKLIQQTINDKQTTNKTTMANKKNERFNHSYTHCTGEDCERREDCVNYLAYQEAVELGLKDIKTAPHCKNLDLDYVRVRIEK